VRLPPLRPSTPLTPFSRYSTRRDAARATNAQHSADAEAMKHELEMGCVWGCGGVLLGCAAAVPVYCHYAYTAAAAATLLLLTQSPRLSLRYGKARKRLEGTLKRVSQYELNIHALKEYVAAQALKTGYKEIKVQCGALAEGLNVELVQQLAEPFQP